MGYLIFLEKWSGSAEIVNERNIDLGNSRLLANIK